MRAGADPAGSGDHPRVEVSLMTAADCDAWAHVLARWWIKLETDTMGLFRLSRADDRRDAKIMVVAQHCPHARWTNTRGDVSMMRQAHCDIALRRKWDSYYSVQPVDQW